MALPPRIYNPMINYRLMTHTATQQVMQENATFYDAEIDSDGGDGVINMTPPLTVRLVRGKPKSYNVPTAPEQPTQSPQRRTTDIFAAQAVMLDILTPTGGRTLAIDGLEYTIVYIKPHTVAGVCYFVELHCDLIDGSMRPALPF